MEEHVLIAALAQLSRRCYIPDYLQQYRLPVLVPASKSERYQGLSDRLFDEVTMYNFRLAK